MLISITFLLTGCSYINIWQEKEEIVIVSSDTLKFKAYTSIANAKKAITLIRNNKTPIKTIIVNSNGGDVKGGMLLGRFIYKNKLNLIVNKNCFSSCANYLFTAAYIKDINKDSEVGWHGGSMQPFWEFPKDTPEEQKQLFYQELKQLKQEEKNFFDLIHVDQRVTYLGTIKPYKKQRTDKPLWTYSLKDIKNFGIKNVHFKGTRIYKECDLLILK